MADESCELGCVRTEENLEIPYGSQRNINENCYRLQKIKVARKSSKTHRKCQFQGIGRN